MSASLSVFLVVTSTTIDPAEIGRRLGLTASRTWRAGDLISPSKILRQHHGWVLESGAAGSASLAEHVRTLLERLPMHSVAAGELVADCEAEIACVVRFGNDAPELCLAPGDIETLGRLRVGIDIDLLPA